MKVCAITMVYRDYWALTQWYRHYGALLGPEHLYIVSHGFDPRYSDMCPGANIITIPRDDLTGFDKVRGQMLNSFQDGLGQIYDWVIRTDTDELICVDPEIAPTLQDFLARQTAPALFALGLNVIELPDDMTLGDANVFDTRKHCVFTGHYSKAFAVRDSVALMRHGVQVRQPRVKRFPFVMPEGCYLAHLKFANSDALKEANQHRMEIAALPGKGMPGPAWEDAEDAATDFLARAEAMPFKPWEDGRAKAFEKLSSNPVRDQNDRLVRARTVRFKFRTKLPDWFGAI
ncbi:MAG: glycosyltransferase family 2 protein [Aliishimia sp.]